MCDEPATKAGKDIGHKMAVTTKRLEFSVDLDEDGRLSAPEAGSLETPGAWTPEHLLLAALARCSGSSLSYHAKRASLEVSIRTQTQGVVARREGDGRFAFTEIDIKMVVESDRDLPTDELWALLAKAERDCFVGASLEVSPNYSWTVNGTLIRDAPGETKS